MSLFGTERGHAGEDGGLPLERAAGRTDARGGQLPQEDDWGAALADLDAFLQKEVVTAPCDPPVFELLDDPAALATDMDAPPLAMSAPPLPEAVEGGTRRWAMSRLILPFVSLIAIAGGGMYFYRAPDALFEAPAPATAPATPPATAAPPPRARDDAPAATVASAATHTAPEGVPEATTRSTVPSVREQRRPIEETAALEIRTGETKTSGGALPVGAAEKAIAVRDMSGTWRFDWHVESDSASKAANLDIGFQIHLDQAGTRIKGTGRRMSENGNGIAAAAQTPISLDGTIDGNRATLTFTEHAPQRLTQGKLVLIADGPAAMVGRFSTTAAESSGPVEAHRLAP